MSCAHEHGEGSGHGEHNHGGHGGHGHDHSHDVPLSSGPADSLYSQIDIPHVVALNVDGGGEAGQNVIKTWEDREDESKWCESDADDSLIIRIPFVSSVSLRSITIKAGPAGRTPSAVHLFRDAPGMDFSDAEAATPTQILDMVEGREGMEYQVKAAKFRGMTSLVVYIPSNNSEGEEETSRIYYVGMKGKWTALPNRPGVIIYESAARPADHKTEHVTEGASYRPGF